MKLIVHDLPEEQAKNLFPKNSNTVILHDDGTIHSCIGCFGCWVKTPSQCVIRDHYGDMGKLLAKCDEVILVSKCCFGGFSPFVKAVLDRSIPYIHPYFTIRNAEMHHQRRYDNHIKLKAFFYGENITEEEKRTAAGLLPANALNLDCQAEKPRFAVSADLFKEEFK